MQLKYKFKILFFTFLHTIFEFFAFNIIWVFKFFFSIITFPLALVSKRYWELLFGEEFHTTNNFLEIPLINYDYLEMGNDTENELEDKKDGDIKS